MEAVLIQVLTTLLIAPPTIQDAFINPPIDIEVVEKTSELDLHWTNTEVYDFVVIDRSLDGVNFTFLASVGSGNDAHNDVGLGHQTYYYRLRGQIGNDFSGVSAIASGHPL